MVSQCILVIATHCSQAFINPPLHPNVKQLTLRTKDSTDLIGSHMFTPTFEVTFSENLVKHKPPIREPV